MSVIEQQKQRVPALRFPDFNEAWSEQRLGSNVEIYSGQSPSKLSFSSKGKTPFIKVDDLNNSIKYQMKSRSYLEKDSGTVPKGAIIFPKRGAAILNNKIRIANLSMTMDTNLMAIKPNDKDLLTEFLFYKIFKDKLYKIADTSTIPQLNNKHIVPYKVFLPKIEEQKKIAFFLSSFDRKIEQLTRKSELLKQYKKGMMQKIFSQTIRFKDDQGNDFPDWEEKKAGDIFHTCTNKNHNGQLPILAATQDRGVIPRKETGLDIKSSKKSVKSYKIIEPGDFVISLRSFQGGIEYSEYLGICSPAYIVLKPLIRIIHNFFKLLFKKEDFISRLNNTVIGIRDGKQIPFISFAAMKLSMPSLEEQEKIALFLSAIDKKIDLINTELDYAKKFKKGLLQQMFV